MGQTRKVVLKTKPQIMSLRSVLMMESQDAPSLGRTHAGLASQPLRHVTAITTRAKRTFLDTPTSTRWYDPGVKETTIATQR
jgi:hypothetical protein